MATAVINEKQLRIWAMDRPELNTLIDGVRFSPEDIENAMIMVVDRWNVTLPPSSMYTLETFPSMSLLCLGTWGWLLRGAAIGEASNNFTYSAEGIQINDRDKAEIFSSIGEKLWQEYIDTVQQVKLAQSIKQVFGTHNSEYIYRFY
jgi:hypothetical protein